MDEHSQCFDSSCDVESSDDEIENCGDASASQIQTHQELITEPDSDDEDFLQPNFNASYEEAIAQIFDRDDHGSQILNNSLPFSTNGFESPHILPESPPRSTPAVWNWNLSPNHKSNVVDFDESGSGFTIHPSPNFSELDSFETFFCDEARQICINETNIYSDQSNNKAVWKMEEFIK
ncbi:hypothetical protein Fcan01_23314 [Folsomia candida]|uniref:Uncharacterized protein n=1 Tax=Folsomia candida TaxID=158441 RepID=A0A226D9G9_FOLCA|nr:hypothetical protein Fcan01_23314 [Folsomia candida]